MEICFAESAGFVLKGCHLESLQDGGNFFFSRVNFLCWLLSGVCSTPVLQQWHVEHPVILPKVQVAGCTKTCIHLDPTKSKWADTLFRHNGQRTHQGDELTQSLLGNAQPVVSACWANGDWSWPEEWMCYLSALKKKSSSQIVMSEEKSTATTQSCYCFAVWFNDDNNNIIIMIIMKIIMIIIRHL